MTATFKKIRARYQARLAAQGGERGDTLVEVLLALIVLSLASVALITALGTTVTAEGDHRALATFNTVLASSTQQALSEIEQSPTLFTACPANAISYYQTNVPITVASPYTAKYTATITSVQYWQGTAFGTTCVNNVPQEIQVTATANATNESHNSTFIAGYSFNPSEASSGTAAKLVFVTEPGSGSGGAMLTTQPIIRIEDANNATVLTDLSPVTLSLASGTTGAVLSGCSGDEVLGIVTFSGCVIDKAGTYTISATDGSLPTAISTSFSVSSAPPSLVFTTQPVAGGSGNALDTQPVLNVDNTNGSIDTSFSATIALSSSNATLSGCTRLNAVRGVITPMGCSFSGLIGTYYTITATASGVLPVTSNSITPSGPGSATQLVFTSEPTGLANSNPRTPFGVQPVVSAEDAAGNIVTNYSSSITLSISAGETLSCSFSTTAYPSSGVASWSNCEPSADANNVTLKATSGSLSVVTDPFNITGVVAKLVFSTEPVSVVSGAPLFTQPVISEEDSKGNVVTSSTIPITLSASGGNLSLCSGLTPSSGVVTVVSCVFGGTIGTPYTLTASTGSFSATSTAFSPSTTGSAYKLVFTTQPVAGLPGAALTTEPVIKIEDQGGNVVTNSSRTITITSTGTITGCSNLTAVSGVVNVTGCKFTGSLNTPYSITVASSGLVSATSNNFEVK